MHYISAVYARFVLRELTTRGIDSACLFSHTSLNRERLETESDISVEEFVTFLENARAESGDEKLGLMIGEQSTVVVLGPMGVAAATAPSVRTGLQFLEKFSRLHATYVKIELTSTLSGMSVVFRFLESLGVVERFHAEASVMLVQNYVETLTGRPLLGAQYHLGFPKPSYADDYQSALHGPVSFDAQRTTVELPADCLDERTPYYNEETWRQMQLQLSRRLKFIGHNNKKTYTEDITALLRSNDPPLPDIAMAAEKLFVSERTLSRRLQEENTSFRAIKSELLNSWAKDYLRETKDSVEAISAALGYQDAANFRRAFKKWEDCSPQVFRIKQRHLD